MTTPVSQPTETPVLTPEVSKALLQFQKEYVWTFDSEIDDIKDFIILYYSDEVPDKAMKVLGTLQLIQRTLRELIPEERN
nr:MAG TPA: hypothetical protein [Caudoviricetes sp.]